MDHTSSFNKIELNAAASALEKQKSFFTQAKKLIYPRKWYVWASGLVIYDLVVILASFYAALYISFECNVARIPAACMDAYIRYIPLYLIIAIPLFSVFRLYNSIWRQVSYYELCSFSCAILLSEALYFIWTHYFLAAYLPIRYFIIGGWLQLWLILACRFSYRVLCYVVVKTRSMSSTLHSGRIKHRAMLIGAGAAGQIILRDVLASNDANVEIKCIIDDDSSKWSCRMSGVPIVGGKDDILLNVKNFGIEEILLAIPTISTSAKRDILNISKESGCKMRILPGIYSLVNGDVSLTSMREVTIEELLGREPIKVNLDGIFENLRDKTILVTGGGGSIGSELCRQIAKHNPKTLVIFDIYENNAYDIEQELRRSCPQLNLKVLIGSVRDSKRINQVFETYRPEIVFHAAAHKHVPLMEGSPFEAIKNNVCGTYKTACAAMLNGCKRFVLISTDKAVNPTNIMGASKRLCEMVIQTLDKVNQTGSYEILPNFLASHELEDAVGKRNLFAGISGRTEFVAVRFGNVLGSNGSVIPLFKKQIERGGPVTVTHPDIIRYFMTIPEAVSLVLEAATYAQGGEIFVLDMGAPVKIDSLARNLIKLCGFTPDVDIKIEYSGLRPGEKLFEEKLMAEEGLRTTSNKLIYVAKPLTIEIKPFLQQLAKLTNLAYDNKSETIVVLKELVPGFQHKKINHSRKNYGIQRKKKIQPVREKNIFVISDNA